MKNRTLKILAFGAVVLGLFAGCSASENSVDDVGNGDGGPGTDTDTDTGTDTNVDAGCVQDERICVDDVVHESNCEDGTTTEIETCEEPRYCFEGECHFDGEFGLAVEANSNVGCEYWTVDLDNSGTASVQPYAVAVSNVGIKKVHVKIEARAETGTYIIVTEASISPKDVKVFELTGEGVSLSPTLDGLAGSYHQPAMAYRVTSDNPVIAYQFNPYSGLTEENASICSNDATLLIPTSGIDRHYYALTFEASPEPSAVNIVGTKDGTHVKVTPTGYITGGWDLEPIMEGETVELELNAADVVQLESEADLTGTYIEADKPVVVFAGNVTAFVPTNVMYADHLEHQMIPITKWGTKYIAARSRVRSKFGTPERDFYRIIAAEDGTVVETEPVIKNFPATLNKGEMIQVAHTGSFSIEASAPIMVGQFIAGSEATSLMDSNKKRGDPSFALLAPVEQFLKEYVFLAPDKYPVDYMVVTHPAGIDVELDGTSLQENPLCVADELNADWGITRCEISDFTHTLLASKPIGITVWGYGDNVSYGYTGGLSLETINPIVK
jgi:IgGFc binding protein